MYSVFDSISWHGDRKAETSLYSIERRGLEMEGGGRGRIVRWEWEGGNVAAVITVI